MGDDYRDELDRMRSRRRDARAGRARRGRYEGYEDEEYEDGYDDGYSYEGEEWDGYPDGTEDEDWDGYDEYEYGRYEDGRNGARDRGMSRTGRQAEAGGRGGSRSGARNGGSRSGTSHGGSNRSGTRNGGNVGRRPQSGGRGGQSAYREPAGRPGGRKKPRRRGKLILLEVLALILVAAGVYFFMHRQHKDGYWTIAIFGVDSRDGNLGKGTLADVQMICNIDEKTGSIQLVSVFRDTYLKIDSKNYHKINEAYFKGGASQAVDALNENLDLNIDDYATFNWKAVADAINILGGIDLEITDREFKYINSFISETVEKTGVPSVHLDHAGPNHLDGAQAVAYARLRLMDDDYTRTARQRKVIALAMEKAKQADWAVLNNLLVTVLPQVSTSIGADDLVPIARNLSRYQITETSGFPFSRTTAMIGTKDCVIPTTLESNVVQLHQMLFPQKQYSPSSTVRKISAKVAKDSGYSEVGKNAGSSNPGGGSGGGGGGGSGGQPQERPQETEPLPTESLEPTEESSIEESVTETTEETTAEDMYDYDESDSDRNEDVGPGIVKPPSGAQAPSQDKPTLSDPDENSGPGVEPSAAPVAPSPETSAAPEQGPVGPVGPDSASVGAFGQNFNQNIGVVAISDANTQPMPYDTAWAVSGASIQRMQRQAMFN